MLSDLEILNEITHWMPSAQVEAKFGVESSHQKKQFRNLVMRLARSGRIVRTVFDGELHLAPEGWEKNDEWAIGIVNLYTSEDADGCLIWSKATNKTLGPVLNKDRGKGSFLLRRLVFENAYGRNLNPQQVVKMKCGCDNCLNPEHMIVRNRQAALRGVPKSLLARSRLSEHKRKNAILSAEQVQMGRDRYFQKQVTQRGLAAEWGVSRSTVSAIMSGKTWQDYSNPFLGMGARL